MNTMMNAALEFIRHDFCRLQTSSAEKTRVVTAKTLRSQSLTEITFR